MLKLTAMSLLAVTMTGLMGLSALGDEPGIPPGYASSPLTTFERKLGFTVAYIDNTGQRWLRDYTGRQWQSAVFHLGARRVAGAVDPSWLTAQERAEGDTGRGCLEAPMSPNPRYGKNKQGLCPDDFQSGHIRYEPPPGGNVSVQLKPISASNFNFSTPVQAPPPPPPPAPRLIDIPPAPRLLDTPAPAPIQRGGGVTFSWGAANTFDQEKYGQWFDGRGNLIQSGPVNWGESSFDNRYYEQQKSGVPISYRPQTSTPMPVNPGVTPAEQTARHYLTDREFASAVQTQTAPPDAGASKARQPSLVVADPGRQSAASAGILDSLFSLVLGGPEIPPPRGSGSSTQASVLPARSLDTPTALQFPQLVSSSARPELPASFEAAPWTVSAPAPANYVAQFPRDSRQPAYSPLPANPNSVPFFALPAPTGAKPSTSLIDRVTEFLAPTSPTLPASVRPEITSTFEAAPWTIETRAPANYVAAPVRDTRQPAYVLQPTPQYAQTFPAPTGAKPSVSLIDRVTEFFAPSSPALPATSRPEIQVAAVPPLKVPVLYGPPKPEQTEAAEIVELADSGTYYYPPVSKAVSPEPAASKPPAPAAVQTSYAPVGRALLNTAWAISAPREKAPVPKVRAAQFVPQKEFSPLPFIIGGAAVLVGLVLFLNRRS